VKDLSERIANLSPEKRRLLKQLLARETGLPPDLQSELEERTGADPDPGRAEEPEVDPPVPPLTLNLDADSLVSAPAEAKAEIQRFYDTVSRQLDATIFGDHSIFLNYGYVADGSPERAAFALAPHTLNQHNIKLVLEVIGQHDLNGASILDVGCGRGGTIHTILQYFRPQKVVGLDLSPQAIEFCRRRYPYEQVTFTPGDAEALSFGEAAFDFVINIESSHSYSDIGAFYRGVHQVLKPNGVFLYTDNILVETWQACLALLQAAGFILEVDRDITRNVLLSCDEQSSRRVQTFNQNNSAGVIQNFLAVPGSQIYETMKSGGSAYRILNLRKADRAEPAARLSGA
jgi:phthiocerol/phenolphthiocerol synthesis type-I polyketide synthase E